MLVLNIILAVAMCIAFIGFIIDGFRFFKEVFTEE